MERGVNKGLILTLVLALGLLLLCACGKEMPPSDSTPESDLAYVVTQKAIDFSFQEVIDGYIYDGQIYIAGLDEQDNAWLVTASPAGEVINAFAVEEIGSVAMIMPGANGEILWLSNAADTESKANQVILSKSDSTGAQLLTMNISEELKRSQGNYIASMVSDRDGNLYLATDGNEVLLYDKEGQYQGTINAGSRIYHLLAGKDGIAYIVQYPEQEAVLSPLDMKTRSLGNAVRFQTDHQNPDSTIMLDAAQAENLFVVNDGNALYLYDMNSRTGGKVFDWVACGIKGENVKRAFALSKDSYFVFTNDFMAGEKGSDMLVVERSAAEDIPAKTVLTYGTVYLDPLTESKIIEFNQSHQEYFIDVINYDLESDPEGAMLRMTADILSGNCPDIIDVKMNDAEELIAAGVLTDLYAFMEKDEAINRDDFLANILGVYERDEKLYAIMPFFLVRTIVGKTSLVGSSPGWTAMDIQKLKEDNPSAKLWEGAAADTVLQTIINGELKQFMDWETGECDFTREEFIRLLEFAGEFDTTAEAADYTKRAEQLQTGEYLLANAYIYNIKAYREQKCWFGEDVTFVGYPVSEGVGNLVDTAVCSLAISGKSPYQEVAWEFISGFLQPEYQGRDTGDFTFGFPIRKDAMASLIKQEMTPDRYMDEAGQEVEIPKSTWSDGVNNQTIELYAATGAEMEEFQLFIAGAESLYDYNKTVIGIICEEAAAYWTGQKQVEDVAGIIQSRVKIYVNENR